MTEQTTYQELAHRANDGMDVTLFWSKTNGRLAVQVSDTRSGDFFELEARCDRALDVFHHPYAYAAFQGIANWEGVADEISAEADAVLLGGSR